MRDELKISRDLALAVIAVDMYLDEFYSWKNHNYKFTSKEVPETPNDRETQVY